MKVLNPPNPVWVGVELCGKEVQVREEGKVNNKPERISYEDPNLSSS